MSDHRPDLVTLARKTTARLRARGAAELASLATARLLEALWSDEKLIVLWADAGGAPPKRAGLVLRPATTTDAERYARDVGTDSAETFTARLDAATSCYLVLEGDRILHASWVTRAAAWTRELGGYLQPPPGDAYVFESYTSPAARGRGIYPLALLAIRAHLGERGAARAWVATEDDNLASLRAVTKAGFLAACVISYRRRLGRLRVDAPRRLSGWTEELPLLTRRADAARSGAGGRAEQAIM